MTILMAVAWPDDKNGKEINIGSRLHLEHNDKIVTVRSLEFLGNNVWHIWPHESGGGISYPACKDDITCVLD
jgi:hypothetical protein